MVAHAIQVVDETPAGQEVRRTELRLVGETATLRELIEQRVRAEVERWNQGPDEREERWAGLVQPAAEELALNQRRPRPRPPRATVDAEAQVAAAVEAFARGRFLMFVGDTQVDDLDRMVEVVPGLELRFVKLVPLVGG